MKEFVRPWVFAMLGGAMSSCSHQSSSPYRADCIVKIEFEWPAGTTDATREAAINVIIGRMHSSVAPGGSDIVLPSLALPVDNRSAMYMQFLEQCDERFDIAERIVSIGLAGVEGAPLTAVSHDRIEPGEETINVWGPPWRDHPR